MLGSDVNFTVTFISRIKNDITEIRINTDLFSKHMVSNMQCNSMEEERGHFIPLTPLEKSYLVCESAACRFGIVPGQNNTDQLRKDHQSLSRGWRVQ